jgi:hypothetical protein
VEYQAQMQRSIGAQHGTHNKHSKKAKVDKHKIRREITANSKQINLLLTTHKPEEMPKIHALFLKNEELRLILNPKYSNKSVIQHETSNPILEKIQKQYNMVYGPSETKGYCKNCGAVNGNNMMNGKLWCFGCNQPLIVTYKKPQQNSDPKVKALKTVTEDEQKAFYQRQKELGV